MLRELEKLSYSKVLIMDDNMRFRTQIKEMVKEVILKPNIVLAKDINQFYETLGSHKFKIIIINSVSYVEELKKNY